MLNPLFFKVISLTLFLGGGFLSSVNASGNSESLQKLRHEFIQAENALSRGKISVYQEMKKDLKHYPLYPYLLFQEYERRLPKVSYRELHAFLENYQDSPLAEQLRFRWLQAKAKQEDWPAFLEAYEPTDDMSMQCYYLWASLQTTSNRHAVLKEITPLWMSAKPPAKSCEAVFQVWEKSGMMSRPMVWQRTKAFIQAGHEKCARKMKKYLRQSEMALVELWLMVRNNPKLVTNRKYFTNKHPANLEMIVDGVSLIAKTKPEAAIKLWQQIAYQYPFEDRHWGLVVRAIGLTYAFQRHPEAEKWLSKVPAIHANQAVHEWRIRISLGKEDWPKVMKWIDALPPNLAKTDEWQYWRGRALEAVNQRETAEETLHKLANIRSYYGFLASHHLVKPYPLLNQKIPVEKSVVNAMAHKTSIQRARELYLLKRLPTARAEWLFITKNMSDKEKHAAAHLAMHWELPNWAILALSKAENKDNLALRFPVVYGHHVLNEAKKHDIDPALILAITRQESAFVPHAKSSAGAMGLMQLIPSTAHMVAKRKNIPYSSHEQLLHPHTNIQLGSGYFKMMLEKYQNNAVLAAAAYNAGPGRIQKWLPTDDMAADLWIETIPYKETREYVKNILTYTAIYQEILGKKPHLARHMPYITKK